MKFHFTFLWLLTIWGVTHAQVLSPADGATGVSATQEISVRFDREIEPGENFYKENAIKVSPAGFMGGSTYIDYENHQLMIGHTSFTGGLVCTVTIEPEVIKGQTEKIEWSFTVKTPEPVSFTPADGATGVAYGDVISVLFDMEIKVHENESFYRGGISASPFIYDLNPYFNEDKNGVIIGYATLASETNYTMNIAADVLVGQPNPITWSFTTKKATVESVYPADGMTAIPNSETNVVFNMLVESGENIEGVTITPNPGDVFAFVAGRKLTIDHGTYTSGETYTVTVPANAVKGIDQEIKWSFMAQDIGLASVTPKGGEIGVAVDAEVKAEFKENIPGESVSGITFDPAVSGVSGTVSGKTLTIAHDHFIKGTDYTVTIPGGAIEGVTTPVTWPFTTIAPAILSSSIVRNQTGVAVDQLFQLIFEGNISQGVNFADINLVPDPGNVNVSIDGATLKIEHADFAGGTVYTVTIPANAIKGQLTAYTWSFTTVAPVVTAKTPADKAVQVTGDAVVAVDFDLKVTAGTLSGINFSPAVTGVAATVSGNTLTIAHNAFTSITEYTVTVPSEAINGLTAPISWKFTTKAPEITARDPVVNALDVETKALVGVMFDLPVVAGAAIGDISFTPAVNDVKGTVNGKYLAIAHADLANITEYTVTIPANAVKGQTTDISWSFKTKPLSYQTRTPAADARYIGVDDEVSIVFDADITPGTGFSNIAISPSAGESCAISGNKLTIRHTAFANGADYTVTVPAGALNGLTSDISWSFSTIAPAVQSKTPAARAIDIATDAGISIVFASDVEKGVAFDDISISPVAGAITRTISGNTITITHGAAFAGSTAYTVTIPVDAVKGQTEEIKWTFTTAVVLGMDDMNKLEAKMYPNPVQAGMVFTIFTDDNSIGQRMVEILNATGVMVQKTVTGNQLIRLTAPKEPGVYLLRITSGNKSGVYRLVVH